MDEKQGMQKLSRLMAEHEKQAKAQRRAILRKQRAEDAKGAEAKKRHAAWVEEHGPKAREAARALWKWYEHFVTSDEFARFRKAFPRGRKKVKISRMLTCSIPDPRWIEYSSSKVQMFVIDAGGTLYVNNLVKYGKVFPLVHEDDLLEHVAWPILIEVASTIADGTIWDILDIS